METVFLATALLTFIYLSYTIIEFAYGFNKITNLSHQLSLTRDQLPSVSIIFSALNEEKELEKALRSLINLDYPHFEIIAINDRSTDNTPIILEGLKREYPRLHIYHINQLPDGWLGKNHALQFASKRAHGEWLLFTDADVSMKPNTLTKTISYALLNKLDHLTLQEHHQHKDFWMNILLLGHYITYSMNIKPWRIRYSWSKKSLGHGAFNLVRKEAYLKCGGHQPIAMECLDDLKLGELLKKNGFHQDIVDGRDFIERDWYRSLKEMIEGLKKNGFAYFEYRVLPTIRDIFVGFVFFLWPFIAATFFSGPQRKLNLLNICLTFFISAYVAKQFRLQKRYALLYPISITILLYTIIISVITTYRKKGIVWRGTYYPLQKIKKKNTIA